MKPKNTHFHHTPKTKDDFVRWLTAKRALKEQSTEKQLAITKRDNSQALMVWADDGGARGISHPMIKTIEQSLPIKSLPIKEKKS